MGDKWITATADEIGRLLAQGNLPDMPHGTDTIHFIKVSDIPAGQKATYLKIVAADKPNKAVPQRIRFTVGGDKIVYDGIVSTKTAELTSTKILINSVLSTPGAKFMTCDIKDFYLNTPMDKFEYMRIPVRDIPATIMDQYNLFDLIHNDHVYVEIRKGMYGLPHAGKIANDRLVQHLATHGYHQAAHTPGLFRHATRPVTFVLVVDDFGVKYIGQEHAQHLLDTLRLSYELTEDWTGSKYCGLTLKWDYINRTCDISMPGYVQNALQRFGVPPPSRPQDSPHAWQKPQYGAHTQLTAPIDSSPPLPPSDLTRLQEVIGTLLYYGRAVDSSVLVALGSLATAQTIGTEATAKACAHLLNYCATHPDASVRFHGSDMILQTHCDASYLSETKARSRFAGYHFLGDITDHPPPLPLSPANLLPVAAASPTSRLNGAVLLWS